VPCFPVVHDAGEPRCRVRVLVAAATAGDPDNLGWGAQADPTGTGLSRAGAAGRLDDQGGGQAGDLVAGLVPPGSSSLLISGLG
jgi:hypothetical protein